MLARLAAAVAALCGTAAATGVAGDELPMTKVIRLLQDMKQELEEQLKEDKDVYEKLSCWCEKNKKATEKSQQDGRVQVDGLESATQEGSGKKGELSVEITGLKEDVDENEKALKEATALRDKEAAEFHAEEVELIESIKLLEGAIIALAKHHESMLQNGLDDSRASVEVQQMMPNLRKLVHENLPVLSWLGDGEKQELLGFLDATPELFDADPRAPGLALTSFLQRQRRTGLPYRSYAPQSGQILGILKQMKESFEAKLPLIRGEEQLKAEQFAEVKGAKRAEIKEQRDSVKMKSEELSDEQVKLVGAKADMARTKADLEADQAFLVELAKRCEQKDHDWERRKKLRLEEIKAVGDAIAILSEDAALDGQAAIWGGKKKGSSFLQLQASSHHPGSAAAVAMARGRAVAALKRAGARSPEVLGLLAALKGDPFAKVIAEIEKLIAKLNAQQADEVKFRDFCVEELHQAEVDKAQKEHAVDQLDAKIEELTQKRETVVGEIETLNNEIVDLHAQLKAAGEDRIEENHGFQQTSGDQLQAVTALEKAYSTLAAFYHKAQSALLQQRKAKGKEPVGGKAPEFEAYRVQEGGNEATNLIMKLIGEAKVIQEEAARDEQAAQEAYESLIKETNESVEAKSRTVIEKTEELARIDQERAEAIASRDALLEDLKALAETVASLHKQCDALLENFTARQAARMDEIDALNEVKAILRGAKFAGS